MRYSWFLAAVCLTTGLTSCDSEERVGPTLHELRGTWILSWTESGSGTTCTWSGVELVIRDSTAVPSTGWGGGLGACAGVYESGEITFRDTALDSLHVGGGRIRFATGDYRFQGVVGADRMNGTVSSELPLMIGGEWGPDKRAVASLAPTSSIAARRLTRACSRQAGVARVPLGRHPPRGRTVEALSCAGGRPMACS